MTKDQVQTAIREGIPFLVRMADGQTYEVKDRYNIALSATTIIIVDEKDLAHVLPLLTVTGITYLKKSS